jgi:mRNA deadenylase 3'-5' endonuclease subunit Ccr4
MAMTDQDAADFLSKEYRRPVSLEEAKEINRDLMVLAEIVVDSYLDFKKKEFNRQ